MLKCPECSCDNRDIAKHCKRCGVMLDSTTTDELLGKLVGLPEVRRVLEDLRATVEGMLRNKQEPRIPFNTLILGNSGTAKSLIGSVITSVLNKLGVVKKPKPVTLDALTPDALTPKDLESAFESAKGGVLFVDNVHKLMSADGNPLPLFNRLIKLIDGSPLDPIVILAGLPFGLSEFLGKRENNNLSGRFQNVFRIADYPPDQLVQIAAYSLVSQGFILSAEAHAQLERRFHWLYRQTRKSDSTINVLNGHLAIREAQAVAREYYKRPATDHRLLPEDIKGPVEKNKPIEEILAELDGFIGMAGIKKEIRELYEDITHARGLAERGLGAERRFAYHFTITGNPGTGKTTIARCLGEIFAALGVLPSGHVVEVDRSKLVAQFQGQTGPLVQQACDQAMGGILFIDEAYALKASDSDSFGQEAIDTLLKRMEDDAGKFIVIAAGYPKEIADFLKTNPGLQSRFTRHYRLDDYSPQELMEIFDGMIRKQGFTLDAGAKAAVVAFFKDRCARKTSDFANGREARNLLTPVLRTQGERMRRAGDSGNGTELVTITAEDIPVVGSAGAGTLDAAMKQLNDLVGLRGVKNAVARLQSTLSAQKLMGENEVLARHFVFTGNPGTGKTTVARIVCDLFFGLGLLPTNNLVEVDRSKLVKGFVGQTAPNVNAICNSALGGVLFIDEAYTLTQSTGGNDSSGQEAIDTLLKRMEDDRGKFVVIAAGYQTPMQGFIDSNPGLRSRFSDFIDFEDYAPAEMATIFQSMVDRRRLTCDTGFTQVLRAQLEQIYQTRDKTFANARTVRQLFDRTFEACAARVTAMAVDDETKRREIRILRSEDLGGKPAQTAADADASLRKLQSLIGLQSVKLAVARLKSSLEGRRLAGDAEVLSKHFVFTGNPGTGKTTVARILADVLQGVGMLPTNTLIEVDRGKLVKGYIGQTAPNVHAVCDSAMGGVLFIDEAYTLAQSTGSNDNSGQEAIDTLLKRMEDDRGKFVVIAAGYTAQMQSFINSNPGLRSRFTDYIEFEDYAPDELFAIFKSLAERKKLSYDDDFERTLRKTLTHIFDSRDVSFANARTVRQLFDRTFEACASRVTALAVDEEAKKVAIHRLTTADLMAVQPVT